MKKILSIWLLLLLSFALAFSLISCDKDPEDDDEEDEEVVEIEDFSVSADSVTLKIGETYEVTFTVTPDDAKKSDLKWKSSDESVATVSKGIITAVSEGSATVTVYPKTDKDNVKEISVVVEPEELVCSHTPGEPVREREKAPDCKNDGGYDNVTYCTECEEELSRDHVTIPKGYHNYVNATCRGCGQVMSVGMKYALRGTDEDPYYELVGLGSCPDTKIVIPDAIDGIPVRVIGDAFHDAHHVESIHIPATVTYFEIYANQYLSGLKEYTVDEDNEHLEARDGVLYYKGDGDGAWLAAYPILRPGNSFEIPSDVVRIKQRAFASNESLIYLNIGDGVKTIENGAFAYTNNLAFIEIGASVTEIGEYAFEYSTDLVSVKIGENVETIGNHAFDGCVKLVEVINLSDVNVTSDPRAQGTYVEHALEIHKGDSLIDDASGMLFITSGGENILVSYIESDEPRVILPDSYNGESYKIGTEAFFCHSEIVTVTVGEGVSEIGTGAFGGCYAMVEVVNHSDLDISVGALDNGEIASRVKVVVTDVSMVEDYQDFLFIVYDDVNYLLAYTGEGIEINLPDYFYEQNYVINDHAFAYRYDIERVTIGAGVTAIGYSAFYNCRSLYELTMSEGVQEIYMDAFSGCALQLLNVPDSVTLIDHYAFAHNPTLKKVTIGSGVESLGYSAFEGCRCLATFEVSMVNKTYRTSENILYSKDGLTLVYYPEGLTAESFTIPETVVTIYDSAFAYNGHLREVVIGDNVTEIRDNAFIRAEELRTVRIGAGVSDIGRNAFYNCTALESVYLLSADATLADYAFGYCDVLTDFYFAGGEGEWVEFLTGNYGNEKLFDVNVVYNYTEE